jgi:hypothetical protein
MPRWYLLWVVVILSLCIACLVSAVFHPRFKASSAEQDFVREYTLANDVERQAIALKYSSEISFSRMLALLEHDNPLCHPIAHSIGRVILRASKTVSEALAICGSRCGDGCFHGLEMEFLASSSAYFMGADAATSPNDTVLRGAQFCAQAATQRYIAPRKCLHGVGHSVISVANYDLQKSTVACRIFADPSSQQVCMSGVFMGFMERTNQFPKIETDSLYPCGPYSDFSKQCYRYKAKYMLDLLGRQGAERACLQLPAAEAKGCVEGFGYALPKASILSKPGSLDALCSDFDGAFFDACKTGAVSQYASIIDDSNDNQCESLAPEYVKLCREMLEQVRSFRLGALNNQLPAGQRINARP